MPVEKQELGPQHGYIPDVPIREALLADLEEGFSAEGIRHRKRAHFRRSLIWTSAIWAAGTLRRLVDGLFAGILLVALSPILFILLGFARYSGGGVKKQLRLGRWATRFMQYQFDFPEGKAISSLKFAAPLLSLVNIFKGDMSFVGPRPVSPQESFADERAAWKRYNLRPGLLSVWWLRKRANIAYNSEVDLDIEYVDTNSMVGDLGIAVRALPVIFFGGGASVAPPKLRFLGVTIDNLTMAEAASKITALARSSTASQICFVNADCVNIAFGDAHYRAALGSSQMVLADGIGVRLAGAILNQNVRENVNGTDMLPFLCAAAEEAGESLYLLGGRPGVPEGAADWILQRYPRLKLAGCRDGYFTEQEEPGVLEEIRSSGADILLVALGAPRQEKWIAAHKDELGAKISIGVGGLLDFYSGRIPRAPVWIREIGMEWFYRFWQEPRRMWRRYFVGNAVFLYRVLEERVHTRISPRTGGVAS